MSNLNNLEMFYEVMDEKFKKLSEKHTTPGLLVINHLKELSITLGGEKYSTVCISVDAQINKTMLLNATWILQ